MYAMHKASRMSAANGKARLCGSSTEDAEVAVGEAVLSDGAMIVCQVKIGLVRWQNTDSGGV